MFRKIKVLKGDNYKVCMILQKCRSYVEYRSIVADLRLSWV